MKIYKRKILYLLLVFIIGISNTGCGKLTGQTISDPITVTDYKLNTIVKISSYNSVSKDTIKSCLDLCDYYENMCSRTIEGGTLFQVNNKTLTQIPAQLGELIEKGLYYSRISNGAFDITIGSVSKLWDFTAEKPVIPDENAIKEAVKYVDYTKVELSKNTDGTYNIYLPENMIIDLGAIAKGYIADKLKENLINNGITNATIDLGGNILCVGGKNASQNFNIGIKKPFSQTGEILMGLSVNDSSVVSSGTYERYFYENDKFYHHILNPQTGYPYDTDLTGVTIMSKESVTGDCLSTTCFALGVGEGLKLINSLDGIEAVFVLKDGTIHYSDNAKSLITKK